MMKTASAVTTTEFKVLPLKATGTWAHKAADCGLTVTLRPEKFDHARYRIQDGVTSVQILQHHHVPIHGVIDEPTLAQDILMRQLKRIGLLELKA